MGKIFEINTKKDIQDLLSNYKVVVIDQYADWCYPCKVLHPKLVELANIYSSSDLIFAKCNAETKLMEPKGLPTIDFYYNGAIYHTILGGDLKQIEQTLQKISPLEKTDNTQIQRYKSKNSGGDYKNYGKYWQ